jgi:hypothetical protein
MAAHAAPVHGGDKGPPPALPVLLADRQAVVFVATARGIESLRVPRRYWGTEVGVVPVSAGEEEIRATELAPALDAGVWPAVVPRPELLAPALSRLISGEHAELSLHPTRDGLKATLVTTQGERQSFPVAPKDALGLLAAVFHHVPRGTTPTGVARPPRVVLDVRPAPRNHGFRLRLAGVTSGGAPATLSEIGLAPSVLELLLEEIERPAGLFLVAGGPGSGRSHTLALLAATLTARGRKGARIGGPPEDEGGLPRVVEALSGWPFPESLHASAPDFVVVDALQGPGDLVLAARLAASGTLVLAGAPPAEPEALQRTVRRDLDDGSAPAVPVAILAQALIRTVCRGCLGWRPVATGLAERLGFARRDLEEMERRGGLILPAPRGCHDCAGTGSAGLTGVFEFAAPGAGPSPLPRMREDGWRKVLQGAGLPEDVVALTGAHRPLRTLREIQVYSGLSGAFDSCFAGLDEGRVAAASQRAPLDRARQHPGATAAALAGAEAERLARLLSDVGAGRKTAEGSLDGIAGALAERTAGDEALSALLLPTRGFHLARHAVNTALIACRLAAGAGPDLDPREIAILALLHDAGLLEAGVDPGAELPAVASEDDLDPRGARTRPGKVLAGLGPPAGALEGPIREVQRLLADAGDPVAGAPRAELRVQAVALAALFEMLSRAPGSERFADLHDVTPLVLERYGRRFHPLFFRALLRAVPIFPIGCLVELSSGDLARVVSVNEDNHFRPRVEIVSPGQDPGLERRVVDLARAPFLHIRHRVGSAGAPAAGPGDLLRVPA